MDENKKSFFFLSVKSKTIKIMHITNTFAKMWLVQGAFQFGNIH